MYKSPAKLNLFFQVIRKRPDGYHEIASLYQAIDLFDRLFFSEAKSDQITCTDPSIPLDGNNLIARALKIFRKKYPTPPLHIHIEKQIPSQAGLGGGSSNAATALWAINEMMGKPAAIKDLMEMGAEIGSDVPFFFSSGCGYCTGRGEKIEEREHRLLTGFLAKPNFGLSTALVYQNTRIEEMPTKKKFFNDLESAAFRLEPRLVEIKRLLQLQFKQVTMTGSGTAFFCLDGTPSSIEGVSFFSFCSITRNQLMWY